ncbi:hypothetical protein DMO16_03970 [Fictibacillus sp. S7]|nr:hypothetical protein DMO16_03970 [Fictibacillus sp. S7]
MKMKHIFLLTFLFLLSACNNHVHNHHSSTTEEIMDNSKPVHVDVKVVPDKPKKGQPFSIQAKVTQDNLIVTDADEVIFEVWQDGTSQHTKIRSKTPQKNGLYYIRPKFNKAGKYHVIAHVTAREMHTMPQKQFIVQ